MSFHGETRKMLCEICENKFFPVHCIASNDRHSGRSMLTKKVKCHAKTAQRAHAVYTTLSQRRCNVIYRMIGLVGEIMFRLKGMMDEAVFRLIGMWAKHAYQVMLTFHGRLITPHLFWVYVVFMIFRNTSLVC